MTNSAAREVVMLAVATAVATAPLAAAEAASTAAMAAAPLAGSRPNIVLVLTDDQGYGDLACHGNPIVQTPNLDRLHDRSARFRDFHVSPTCAPTRSSLMSGKHEFKNGVTHTILERERMSLKTTTIAQVLQSAGYATGIFGKWHLGDQDEYQPGRRGFDEVFIHGAGGIGQTYAGSCGDAPGNTYFDPWIRHNGAFEKTKGYCTDVFFRQALSWIEAKKGAGPFFAYIACNAPHAPLDCPEEYVAKYRGKTKNENIAKFYGMISNIDDNVGKLAAKLAEWGIDRNTLLIFMTDNGTATGAAQFNAGMRGNKGTSDNGGTRVPSFWCWPGKIAPGDRDQLAAHLDVFPTFAALAGAKVPDPVAKQLEGYSLLPALENPAAPWPDRYLVAHVGRWEHGQAAASKYAKCSVRQGPFLMVSENARGNWALYDLKKDAGQTENLAAAQPATVRKMSAIYDGWWESVLPCLENEDAPVPAANPFKEAFWKQQGGGPSAEAPTTTPATRRKGRK
jgi:arylsulfatase A-like enzyme